MTLHPQGSACQRCLVTVMKSLPAALRVCCTTPRPALPTSTQQATDSSPTTGLLPVLPQLCTRREAHVRGAVSLSSCACGACLVLCRCGLEASRGVSHVLQQLSITRCCCRDLSTYYSVVGDGIEHGPGGGVGDSCASSLTMAPAKMAKQRSWASLLSCQHASQRGRAELSGVAPNKPVQ